MSAIREGSIVSRTRGEINDDGDVLVPGPRAAPRVLVNADDLHAVESASGHRSDLKMSQAQQALPDRASFVSLASSSQLYTAETMNR